MIRGNGEQAASGDEDDLATLLQAATDKTDHWHTHSFYTSWGGAFFILQRNKEV
jgi:hypothetical protein